VLNEQFKSLFETDRSKDLMNELDLPISAKEVTEATKKLNMARAVAMIAFEMRCSSMAILYYSLVW
jgi:hypothetical protein